MDSIFSSFRFNRSEMLKIFENVAPEQLEALKLIKRNFPYRTPKGYMRWDEMARLLAFAQTTDPEGQDMASKICLAILKFWLSKNAPLYCISNELLRAFQETSVLDKSRLLAGLPVNIPVLILLLPDNAIITPEGSALDYLAIYVREHSKLSPSERATFDSKKYNFEFDKVLFIGTCDKSQNMWCSNVGLAEDGRVFIDGRNQLGTHQLSEADNVFVNELRSLAIQVLLAIAYTPDLLSDDSLDSTQKTKHKRHQAKGEPAVRHPRWLGKNYKRPTTYRARTTTGTHSSPRTHWRSGHARWQACGKGRQERKFVWIEPIQVNVGKR